MKKLLLFLICLAPFVAQSQTVKRPKSPVGMAQIRQALDMKVFQDRFFVKNMIQSIRELDASGRTSDPDLMNEIGHENLFTERDGDIIRREAAHKVNRTKLAQTSWDEQVKAINADPFGAFIGIIENQEVPNLKTEELDSLNSVDKTVIPEAIQMLTESGPDVGASTVSVIYDENVIPQ
jgi:hypothetical protein